MIGRFKNLCWFPFASQEEVLKEASVCLGDARRRLDSALQDLQSIIDADGELLSEKSPADFEEAKALLAANPVDDAWSPPLQNRCAIVPDICARLSGGTDGNTLDSASKHLTNLRHPGQCGKSVWSRVEWGNLGPLDTPFRRNGLNGSDF